MELKLGYYEITLDPSSLLIVPYGIETAERGGIHTLC